MAISYSDEYLALQYKSARLLLLKAVFRLFPAIELARRLQRRYIKAPVIDPASIPECRITETLEGGIAHFKTQRWTFVENFFDASFHQYLVTHWPKRRYFTAPFDIHKAYDKGFRWVERNPAGDRWDALLADDAKASQVSDYPAYMQEHPHLARLIDYLRSPQFIKRLEAFMDYPDPLRFNRFQLTASYPGTLVAPHRDSPQTGRNWISLLFFITASGGDCSGSTAILKDNQFKEVIFEPTNLTNTCLIFDPFAPFYHGMRPMAFGKYRWMLSAEYVSAPTAQA